jgi:hypothetical protein
MATRRGAATKEELLLLDILNALGALGGGGGGGTGLATESTLLSILNNMIASQDIEILLVRDTGNSDLVVQQIREYDQGTGAWTTRYEKVDGSPYTPPELVGPLEYLDPSAVLNLVLAELVSLNTNYTQTERVPGMLRVTSSGPATLPEGKKSVSFYNYGDANASLLGQTLEPGERLTWKADEQGDTLGSFAYDALTSQLLIIYLD